MAKDQQALKPSTFISKLPTFIKEKDATSDSVAQEEKQLAGMSRTAGWRVLKEYIGELERGMEALSDNAIATGISREQIGENTIIISQVKQVLSKVLNRVADAREASDKQK